VGILASMAPMRKKRCSSCGTWFIPDARVREKQRTCGKEKCRRAQVRRQQADWRARNRDYAADWRLRKKAAEAAAAEKAREAARKAKEPLPPEPVLAPAVPPGSSVLTEVPWAFAKTALGIDGTLLLGFLCGLWARVAKTMMKTYHAEITSELAQLGLEVAKTMRTVEPSEIVVESGAVGVDTAKTETEAPFEVCHRTP